MLQLLMMVNANNIQSYMTGFFGETLWTYRIIVSLYEEIYNWKGSRDSVP